MKCDQTGKVQLIVIGVILAIAFFLVGGLSGKKNPKPPPPGAVSGSFCCDQGDGPLCKPYTTPDKTIEYNGEIYGLLRSSAILAEGNLHLEYTNKKTPDGYRIVVNSSQSHNPNDPILNQACGRTGTGDLYFKKVPPDPYMFMKPGNVGLLPQYCTTTPDDQLIFVCKTHCDDENKTCSFPNPIPSSPISCFGHEDSQYDVYFRLKDREVPDFIKNCDKSGTTPVVTAGVQRIVPPQEINRYNLHLNTFKVVEDIAKNTSWLSPLCKPAIYLYPQDKMAVNVKVSPLGKMNFTIPQYTDQGWNATAYPDGHIEYDNVSYDYLYYEAEIPDTEIDQPKEGFVVEYKNISNFLKTLLPQLGLNEKETKQFSDYWTSVLPSSPYYKIRIISQKTLSTIAPLSITPAPDQVIRVTLSFEKLEKRQTIPAPFLAPIERRGFTVVEWGGVYKRHPGEAFSCLM